MSSGTASSHSSPRERRSVHHRTKPSLRLGGRILPFDCPPAYAFTRPGVWPALLAAGGLFGVAARRLAGRGAPLLVAAAGGLGLYVAAFAGAQLFEELPSPAAVLVMDGRGALVPSIFANGAAFAAGVFTLVMGLAVGQRSARGAGPVV